MMKPEKFDQQCQWMRDRNLKKNQPPDETPQPPRPSNAGAEVYQTPQEIATEWGVSIKTVRKIFRPLNDVLKIGKPFNPRQRSYITLRIPVSAKHRVAWELGIRKN
jgi:hypothetical protein